MKPWLPATLIGLGLILSSQAALKVMAIGDSMTREYDIQVVFSAPDSSILDANTMNWVEILAAQRNTDIDFGDDKDYGYEYNYALPGADTNRWMQVLDPSSGKVEEYVLNLAARTAMRGDYASMDVIVIMLGGNDVNFEYGDLYNSTAGSPFATSFIANVIANLTALLGDIEDYTTTVPPVPIVLGNVPDLGSTPEIIEDHPDPAKRANASAIIADLNQAVATLAMNRGATLAPISNLTDRILAPEPVYIGAIEMIKGKDPENPPKYLFCKAGLHPSTNGQAVIANTLLEAINTATGSNITLLPDREILTELLGLDPDQPFKDWATTAGLTDLSMTADKDGDGIPSLGEYLLNLDPSVANDMHIANVQNILTAPTLILGYTVDTAAARLANINIKQSTNLKDWVYVPAAHLIDMGSGNFQARMSLSSQGGSPGFFRMEFQIKP